MNVNFSTINYNSLSFSRGDAKKQTQKRHFKSACETRVGEILDSDEITKLIQQRKLKFIDKQSNKITRWKYTHNNRDYMVVYDKKYNQPVTIMPYQEGKENCSDRYWWLMA